MANLSFLFDKKNLVPVVVVSLAIVFFLAFLGRGSATLADLTPAEAFVANVEGFAGGAPALDESLSNGRPNMDDYMLKSEIPPYPDMSQ